MAKTAVAVKRTESSRDEIEQNIQCRGEVNDALLQRIYDQFQEVPGLRLTVKQVQRVWGPDESTCQRLLEALVERKFLRRNEYGTYVQLTDRAVRPTLEVPKARLKDIIPRERIRAV